MDGVRRLQWRYIPGIPRIRETSELYFLVLFPSAPLAPPRPSAHPSPHNPPSVQTPSNCPAELLKDHCSFANILCRSLTIILIRMQIYYKIHPPPVFVGLWMKKSFPVTEVGEVFGNLPVVFYFRPFNMALFAMESKCGVLNTSLTPYSSSWWRSGNSSLSTTLSLVREN